MSRHKEIASTPPLYREVEAKTTVHRSEVLANLTTGVKNLFRLLKNGEIAAVLQVKPREGRPFHSSVKQLSAVEIDQMVHDYQSGVGSLYDLADVYGIHRTTVAQHLKRRGVRVGKLPLEQPDIERARTLHEQGLSLNAIGRELRRDPKTVKAVLR